MNGTIFDIQRFSVHDGPGIRTTVFMKGCPLRCRWCHNPEGLSPHLQLQYFQETCIHCGRCGDRRSLADAERCPSGALKICGREIGTEELMEEVLRDRIFYGEEGGVTFSGGECMMQAEFVAAMLERLKGENISTVLDTSGYAPWSSFEKVLPWCDLYLYDVKMMSPVRHKTYTGVDNRLILDNLHRLSEAGKRLWIRIPVIPDVNDTEEEMTAAARMLAPLHGIEQVRLLPYHVLGKSKYETLSLTCGYHTEKKLDSAKIQRLQEIFIRHHIACEE